MRPSQLAARHEADGEPMACPKRWMDVGLDIETTHLKADFGFILCAVVKPVGEEPIVLRIDAAPQYRKRCWDDSWLVQQLADTLATATRVFGWYSARFDVPYIRTRRWLNGQANDPVVILHADLWRVKPQLLLHSYRLANFLALLTELKKTDIRPQDWVRASHGDKHALDYVVEHCIVDVRGQEEVYNKVTPWVRTWKVEVL